MERLFVKICGVTNLEDALCASNWGADAVGYNFYHRSSRVISPGEAASIVAGLPPGIAPVGVFVNPSREEVLSVLREVRLSALQFSGNESPSEISGFGLPVYKAIHVAHSGSVAQMGSYNVEAFLLDTHSEGEFGGTGKVFDWEIALPAKKFGNVILAGGLTPENVADAVKTVSPFGVDVSSGVEKSSRSKDPDKIKKFVIRAREAHSQLHS